MLSVDKRVVSEGDAVKVTCRAEEESGELNFSIQDGAETIYYEKSTGPEVQKDLALKRVGTAQLSCSYFIILSTGTLYSDPSNAVSVAVRGKHRLSPGYFALIGQTVMIYLCDAAALLLLWDCF